MNEIDCRKCVHSQVCKHRERMVEEIKKFNEVIQEPPLKITISCDEYKEHKPTLREPLIVPVPDISPPWKSPGPYFESPKTGDPIMDHITYTTDNTKPRGVE